MGSSWYQAHAMVSILRAQQAAWAPSLAPVLAYWLPGCNDKAQLRREIPFGQHRVRRQEHLLPVRDMVHKMLLEHQAPPFDGVQQGCLERPSIHFHPAVEDAEGLDAIHLLIDLLVGVDLLFELLQCGGCLRDPVLRMGLDFCSGEDVPVEEELAAELLPVLSVEVGVVVEGTAVLAAGHHHSLHASHQLLAHVSQICHVLHVSLEERGGDAGAAWNLLTTTHHEGAPQHGPGSGGSRCARPAWAPAMRFHRCH